MSISNSTISCKQGFLLQRVWRDRSDGIDIELYIASDEGPIRVLISEQKAICFIEAKQRVEGMFERKATALTNPDGQAVDACYFKTQRELEAFSRQHQLLCFEADVKPSERFLMERFVKAGLSIEGCFYSQNNILHCKNPKIKALDSLKPKLQALSIDIETTVGSDAKVLSIAMQTPQASAVFMAREPMPRQQTTANTINWCGNEARCLEDAFTWLRLADPDLLVGWNVIEFDLAFLQKRCQRLRIAFAIGRNDQMAKILPATRPGQAQIARIPGRAVLDGISLLRSAFWQFDSFSLDTVAAELLGERKLIEVEGLDKVREIERQFHQEPEKLAAYNLKDCELVLRIFDKAALFDFAIARCQITGLAIDRMGGSVAAFDHLYLPRLHRKSQVARSLAQVPQGENSPGGYVLDSKPGLYRNILLLDFKSLYPSIIRTFLIDPAGLSEKSVSTVPGFRQAYFSREQPILPEIIASLWAERDTAKAQNNAPLSQAIKIIMNSFYGVLGSSACRFFDPRLASSITLRGHQIINESRKWFESKGIEVIYGDTDSLFIKLDDQSDAESCHKQGNQLRQELNYFWQQKVQKEFALTSYLEIEFETQFERFWMPTVRHSDIGSKKRYAGLIRSNEQPELMIKGLESVRSDWTPLAQRFQRQLLDLVFRDQVIEDYCIAVYEKLTTGLEDEFLFYSKRIRRPLSAYTKNIPPHIQAARKANFQGRRIRYAMTLNGAEMEGHLSADFDYQHYASKQLAPIANAFLQSSSFEELTAAQMRLF